MFYTVATQTKDRIHLADESQGKFKRYWKQLCPFGEWIDPNDWENSKLVIDEKMVNEMIENFKNKVLDYVPVPLGHPYDSSMLAKLNTGEVIELEVRDDGLYGLIEIRDEEVIKKIDNNLNDPDLIPQPGDIIIWGASQANPWGHIAVVVSADKTGVVVIEQDGFRNTIPAYQAKRGYIYAGMPCIGWLRPRPEKIIGYTPPAPALAGNERVLMVKANARDEANTSAGIFQTIPAGFKVAIKGYITNGQAIDGDTVWFVTARSNKYMSRQVFEDKDLHDLPDLTPKPVPVPEITPEHPKTTENATSENAVKPQLQAPQEAETQKTDDEPSSDAKIQEKKENTMQYDEKAIQEMNKLHAQHQSLVDGVAEADEVRQLVGGIDKRVKLAVYIIGDLLIGAGLILPNIAVAFNFGSLQQIQALSSACATAGAFILTMFGIYKSSKNK